MSVRPIGGPPLRLVEPSTEAAMSGEELRNQLSAMQAANAPLCPSTGDNAGATLTLDDLNETERSAAHIGASPDAFKPIPWMNTHHYTSLLKNNNLDGRLAQMIEVCDTEHSLPFAFPLIPSFLCAGLQDRQPVLKRTRRCKRRNENV